jgi:hypothetical protein
MPKPLSLPILYDELKTIRISSIKRNGFLRPDQMKSGIFSWTHNGKVVSRILITASTKPANPFVALRYKYNEVQMDYQVKLESLPSNLGKGSVWYFICPLTKKRCRNLYLISGIFVHREAFPGCMYESQCQSKTYRNIGKTYGAYLIVDELYDQLYKKHFKKIYARKPTKKYLSLMRKIKMIEYISRLRY